MNKKTIAVILMLCVMMVSFWGCSKTEDEENTVTLRISGAWALYPMMLVWADAYAEVADVSFEISGGGAGKGISDVLTGQVDIGMVSRDISDEEIEQGAFYVAVTKDTVVAVINESNPVYDEITTYGLSQEQLRKIFTREYTSWGEIFNLDLEDDAIVVYSRSDSSGAAAVWAEYLGGYSQADLQSYADSNLNGDQGIAAGVSGDTNAISFSNINYVFDAETGGYADTLRPVPIDLNGDGTLTEDEQFYDSRDSLMENVAAGVYPSPPTRNEYLVVNGAFEGAVKEFVEWILTDGQAYTQENGFIQLPEEDRLAELAVLNSGVRE